MLADNYISKHAYLEKEQNRIEQQGDLATQRSRLREISAAIANQQKELNSLTANFKSDALDKLRAAQDQIAQSGEDAKKTGQRKALTRLTAPVSGTVQQLAIHTIGGVVKEAEALMAIVPDNETRRSKRRWKTRISASSNPGRAPPSR
ncbi:hypothetical protein [Paludibacterium denitrificans]|uniref:hypothetical protein n=1 Tax=Paludibacterium denitrificans TaxID=2675226 RepID=UPI001E46CB32|nr:hypothetical protein [Paludibacterium denitrificans]